MAAGKIDRLVLSSNYQQPGDVYSDTKTEGAFEIVAQQVDANWDDYNALKTALSSVTAGNSGAHNVASAPISGLVGANLYAQLSDLLSKVLTLANTTPYTPTADYHPTTLRYVVDAINAAIVNVGGTAIIQQGTVLPSTPTAGQSFFKTDEDRLYVYSGTAWVGWVKNQQENWITPTFLNGWLSTNANLPVGYYKDEFSIVRIKGRVGAGAVNTPSFTLPTGYKPTQNLYFPVLQGTTIGYAAVNLSGDVTIVQGTNVNVQLDSISFRV